MIKISFFNRIKKFVADTRKKSKGITLGEFTRSYAEARHKEGEKMYEGRCGSVLGMLKHLETFGGSDIPLKKVDVETVKSFITRQDDKFRHSYGYSVEDHPRQCIIVATTNNNDGFLRDITGNRRFWPVNVNECGKFHPWELAEVDQV